MLTQKQPFIYTASGFLDDIQIPSVMLAGDIGDYRRTPSLFAGLQALSQNEEILEVRARLYWLTRRQMTELPLLQKCF